MTENETSQKKAFDISVKSLGCWLNFAGALFFSFASIYGAGLGAVIASDKNPGTENGAIMLLVFLCFPIIFGPGFFLGIFLRQLISKFIKRLQLERPMLVAVNLVLFLSMLLLGFLLGLLPWIFILVDQLV